MTPTQRRQELYGLLGDLPDRNRPAGAALVSCEERENFILEKLLLDLNGIEPVPAYFIKPKDLPVPAPAVLYNHYHAREYDLGKDELLTPKDDFGLPSYADDLAKAGYCVLCIDAWGFGERATRAESAIFKQMLWQGQILWGMMVFDSLKSFDYLSTRAEIDPARIATLGMSMGSTMAWWLAALEERIRLCVDICCLTDFDALIATGGLDEHGIYYYVPSLMKHFTAAQINTLIAPRPHLSLAGNRDPLTPPEGLDRIDRELRDVYASCGQPDNWKLLRYDAGHAETAAMRREILRFLIQRL